MDNNNNHWAHLLRPIIRRPGDPLEERKFAHPHQRGSSPAPRRPSDTPWPLSSRQVQVIEMLSRGLRPVDIARELGCGGSTIANYTARVRDAMGVTSNREAVYKWLQHRSAREVDKALGDKDALLIENLARATAAARATRKEAA